MSEKPLKVTVRHQASVAIINLQGEIDTTVEEALIPTYNDALASNPSAILLNFEDVEYITSIGMAILVRLVAEAHRASRRLAACGLSDHYLEVFQITRLNDFLEIYPDEASALSNL
ncbi:MAG: STAS domain-containing protein [Chloroflexi bacterium]|nr:STAS domain-containing protein [Chloroflexota bacterium]